LPSIDSPGRVWTTYYSGHKIAAVRSLTVAPDGSIWYANFGNSRFGRIGR